MVKKWKRGDTISPEYLNELEKKGEAYDELIAEKEKRNKTKEKQEE